MWDTEKGAAGLPRIFQCLWLEVGGNGKQLQKMPASALGWQRGGDFCPAFVLKETATSERRGNGYSKFYTGGCLQVKGFIVPFQLAGWCWHFCLSCGARMAEQLQPTVTPSLPFVVHQQLSVQLLVALRGFYGI